MGFNMKETRYCRIKLLLFAVLILPCCVFVTITAAEDDICSYFSNGTMIRDPDSCSQSIQCIDHISHYQSCSGAKPLYDKDTSKCVASLSDQSTCHISCTNMSTHFVADPKSCMGYYYCQDEELALFGNCPEGTHFNSTQEACVYKFESECSSNQFNYCSIIKNGVNFKDASNCGKYFVCTNGVLTSKDCKNTYYDPSTGTCIQKSLVDCPAHPYPINVCGTTNKTISNKFIADGATCRGYFFCAAKANGPDPAPAWSQCPSNTFFYEKSQSCVSPLQVQCNEDRCDGRTLKFVSSGTSGCRHYLRCNNGVKTSEDTCGNYFFDEIKGICVSTPIVYESCKMK